MPRVPMDANTAGTGHAGACGRARRAPLAALQTSPLRGTRTPLSRQR